MGSLSHLVLSGTEGARSGAALAHALARRIGMHLVVASAHRRVAHARGRLRRACDRRPNQSLACVCLRKLTHTYTPNNAANGHSIKESPKKGGRGGGTVWGRCVVC